MKKYLFSLCTMLVISSLLVAGAGAYVKYEILAPYGLYQDKSVMELPFLMATDNALTYMLRQHSTPTEPTEPPATTEPTLPPETVATEPVTEPTEPIEETTVPTEPPEPEVILVEESWFDDALFIGNSLGVGLRDYASLGDADYFTVIGMTVFNVRDNWTHVNGVGQTNLERLLSRRTYGKIYIHLGTNECGYPVESVASAYGEMIDFIRQYQPDAAIVIQATMTFGRLKARDYRYMVPETIRILNEHLKPLAEGENIYFIDFNPQVADEEGYLPDEFSGDGCHPTVDGYRQWSQWILDTAGMLGIPAAEENP